MQNIVIDTSSVIAVILDEPEKPRLIKLTEGVNLLAPSSLHWEIGNAFSAMFKRERLSLKDAMSAINIYKKIPIHFIDIELSKALELAHTNNIYAYDAYVITCASLYRATLLTLDETLKKIALDQNIKVLEVS